MYRLWFSIRVPQTHQVLHENLEKILISILKIKMEIKIGKMIFIIFKRLKYD